MYFICFLRDINPLFFLLSSQEFSREVQVATTVYLDIRFTHHSCNTLCNSSEGLLTKRHNGNQTEASVMVNFIFSLKHR